MNILISLSCTLEELSLLSSVLVVDSSFKMVLDLKIGLMSGVTSSQGFCFGKSGEVLTLKIRLKAFTAMMRQVSQAVCF